MHDIVKIFKRRSTPGILVYDAAHRLLFANAESMNLIPDLKRPRKSSKAHEEIQSLCNSVKKCIKARDSNKCNLISAVLPNEYGPPYYLRAFPLTKPGKSEALSQILILVEKVILKHEVNLKDVKEEFDLTNREAEVVKLLCAGLTNKEISAKLSISEYTVKDHMKKLMEKLGVRTRTAIATNLYQR